LQSLLVEKEEALRSVTLEKSKLEVEAEGFNQRLRSLNESEHRYKDENWNLETQIHEHIAAAKESADREKRLTQALNALQAEKAAAQKELDETKLNHARLAEDHAATIKHHDVELGSVKRNMAMVENERSALQRKIDELTGQNQELAMAVSQQRGRLDERDQARGLSDDDFETAASNVTPEHSPPPSPVKGTPRHSMLESETLKSSLHHAHRMLQNLKANIHREKTEKLELKRMLQDARDELEARRGDSLSSSATGRRSKKVDSKEFKKPLKPGQLGGSRSSKSEISMDDPEWEDHQGQGGTDYFATAAGGLARETGYQSSDHFDTANEASDAFETANERGTETEDFHTGAEDLSGDDELTETEGGTVRSKRPADLTLSKSGNRNSFQSTASLSGDDYSYEDLKTPVETQPQRLRLKMNRAGLRRSRIGSEEPNLNSSPASFATSSKDGTPQAPGQTLFAELEDLDGGSEEESVDGTPSRRSAISASGTPMSRPSTARQSVPARNPSPALLSKPAMVDSGMMTEAWDPCSSTAHSALPYIAGASLAGAGAAEAVHVLDEKQELSNAPAQPVISDTAIQWHKDQLNNLLTADLNISGGSRPISTSTYSNMSSQHDPDMEEKLAKFPSPPASPEHTTARDAADLTATPVPLSMSTILSEHVEPVAGRPESGVFPTLNYGEISDPMRPPHIPVSAPLAFSSIKAVSTEPVEPATPPRSQNGIVAALDMKTQETETPKVGILGSVFGWGKNKTPSTPIIAEDETRQSPDQSPQAETPESQKPFREISSNTNERAAKRPKVDMTDESSQTALTAQQIESMLKEKLKRQDMIIAEDGKAPTIPPARGTTSSVTPRKRKSQESIGSVGRARAKMIDPDFAHDTVPLKRPGSAGSNRGSVSSPHPPLPNDHKQVIAAAAQRVGSSSGGPGTMGPPPVPTSSYKANPAFRPRTPSFTSQIPTASSIGRGGTVSRATVRASVTAEPNTPSAAGPRSRRSSVSSFVSEVDNRFNLRQNGMALPDGMDPSTDPRMIQAITQTMIGEYLWKYTRKTGRGEMSENRHRRYFWVHPYTRTLYWSDKDPSQAGRAELKAKSVAIEAVRVVTDDNPMPPGLHRKSLIILTPGRAVKFTAATGQRHETWFNALSYLLLRIAADGTPGDREEVAAGNLTREDVDEFNPAFGNRSTRRGPASLSSYNSRTTRNDSPARLSMQNSMRGPTLAQASNSSRASTGTFKRLSSYWKPGKDGAAGAFSSRRTRESLGGNGSIYEASEVHDSAEDLRGIIEQQDRESDRLENVRACCDGRPSPVFVVERVLIPTQVNTTSALCPTAQRKGAILTHTSILITMQLRVPIKLADPFKPVLLKLSYLASFCRYRPNL
jgi:hypothetical protein